MRLHLGRLRGDVRTHQQRHVGLAKHAVDEEAVLQRQAAQADDAALALEEPAAAVLQLHERVLPGQDQPLRHGERLPVTKDDPVVFRNVYAPNLKHTTRSVRQAQTGVRFGLREELGQ